MKSQKEQRGATKSNEEHQKAMKSNKTQQRTSELEKPKQARKNQDEQRKAQKVQMETRLNTDNDTKEHTIKYGQQSKTKTEADLYRVSNFGEWRETIMIVHEIT